MPTKIQHPTNWPETVVFLCQEQQMIERLPTVRGGLQADAGEIDLQCLQYANKREWPTALLQRDGDAIVQRFEWARTLAGTMLPTFRTADCTETGRMPYPEWEFEPMMIWLLVETWPTMEKLHKAAPLQSLPQRPEPQWPPGPASN